MISFQIVVLEHPAGGINIALMGNGEATPLERTIGDAIAKTCTELSVTVNGPQAMHLGSPLGQVQQ